MLIRDRNTLGNRRLHIVGTVSIIILSTAITIDHYQSDRYDLQERTAISYMESMIELISDHCNSNGIEVDPILDPAKTGLIGPEWTSITSTVGHLDSKRTTINPEFAALMVTLLREAGVKPGDTIALGSSGSFPGLLLSSLAAVNAMDVKCRTIISIGSSSHGANRPDLTILDIYQLLLRSGKISKAPVAVSLGGEGDLGSDWEDVTIKKLIEKIENSGYHFIREETLKLSVDERLSSYSMDESSEIKAFINAGGAMANIGTSETILGLKPGVVRKFRIPEPDQQGVIHKALQSGIPVIHLLNIKGLAMEYGLKWDPVVVNGDR